MQDDGVMGIRIPEDASRRTAATIAVLQGLIGGAVFLLAGLAFEDDHPVVSAAIFAVIFTVFMFVNGSRRVARRDKAADGGVGPTTTRRAQHPD